MEISNFEETESTKNQNLTEQDDEIPKLCEDENFKGLDIRTAKTWIYPINFPLRQYQYDIVNTALFHNTLVSLPTGLGKTMIAAVVMYNIYRWYPLGRIVFMAPTKPLVTQQADACRKITGIPPEDTALLTGDVQSTSRTAIWLKARVLFLTPQIVQRDLQSGVCPAHLIRCLVIDEAHRSHGNYAYCEVIRLLGDKMSKIRVLALSATPGSTPKQVAEIVRNLRISRFEVRTENCPDVKPHVFNKKIETIVVPLAEPLTSVRDQYIQILDRYTRRLMSRGILTGNAGNLHKGRIFMVQKEYKQFCQRSGKRPDSGVMQDLACCLTLYHAYDVLVKHGLRGFLSFYDEHSDDKVWIRKDDSLTALLEKIRGILGDKQIHIETLPDGTIPELDSDVVFGHPKYIVLRNIIDEHFTRNPTSRAMVFCEYRESVIEAFGVLLSCRPLIRPQLFLGQSSITQKQQLAVMGKFREGDCNTLICTCVAEEGLDIACVQLIVCFDIANKSPIRLAQRMGRTGRHEEGRIVMLVTQGREQQTLAQCMEQSNLLDARLIQTPEVRDSLLPSGPPLLPEDLETRCIQMHMTIHEPTEENASKNKKQVSVKKLLARQKSKHSIVETDTWNNQLPKFDKLTIKPNISLWRKSIGSFSEKRVSEVHGISELFHPLSFKNKTRCFVDASEDSKIIDSVLKKAESLRFNLPTQKNRNFYNNVKTKNRDIRDMFKRTTPVSESQSQEEIGIFQTQTKPVLIDSGLSSQSSESSKSSRTSKNTAILVDLLSELNTRKSVNMLLEKKCSICDSLFDCTVICNAMNTADEPIDQWSPPDESVLKFLTADNLAAFDVNSLSPKTGNKFSFENYNKDLFFDDIKKTLNKDFSNASLCNKLNESCSFSLDKSVTTSLFKNENNLSVNRYESSRIEEAYLSRTLDVSDSTSTLHNDTTIYVPDKLAREALDFFGLENIDDLFSDEMSERMKCQRKNGCHSLVTSNPVNIDVKNNCLKLETNDRKTIDINVENDVLSPNLKLSGPQLSPIMRSSFNTSSNKKFKCNSQAVSTPKQSNRRLDEVKADKKEFELWDNSLFLINSDEENDIEDCFDKNKIDIIQNYESRNNEIEDTVGAKNNTTLLTITQILDIVGANQSSIRKSTVINDVIQTPDKQTNQQNNSLQITPKKTKDDPVKNKTNESQNKIEQTKDKANQNYDFQINPKNTRDYSVKNETHLEKNKSQENKTEETNDKANKTHDRTGGFDLWDESILFDESDFETVCQNNVNRESVSPIIVSQILEKRKDANENSFINYKEKSVSPILTSQLLQKKLSGEPSEMAVSQIKNDAELIKKVEISLQDVYFSDEDLFSDGCCEKIEENLESSDDNLLKIDCSTSKSKEKEHNSLENQVLCSDSSSSSKDVLNLKSSCIVYNKSLELSRDESLLKENSFDKFNSDKNVNFQKYSSSNSEKMLYLKSSPVLNNGSLQQSRDISFKILEENSFDKFNKTPDKKANLQFTPRKASDDSTEKLNSSASPHLLDMKKPFAKLQLKRKAGDNCSENRNLDSLTSEIKKEENDTNKNTKIISVYSSDSEDERLLNFAKLSKRRRLHRFDEKNQSFDKSSSGDSYVSPDKTKDKVEIESKIDLSQFVFKKPSVSTAYRQLPSPVCVPRGSVRKKKTKDLVSEFIDNEAEVSDDTGSDESSDDSDSSINSFVVASCTQNTDVDMKAHYLQSVRSPSKILDRRKFKIPQLKPVAFEDICSQPDWQQESCYAEDSFVVNNDEVSMNYELSELEILELNLKKRKRRKEKPTEKRPRRRILQIIDSEDDD